MKVATLIHNPGAGDEEHSKKQLIMLLKSNGLECSYFSTKKKGWEEFKPEADLLIIAGGDGTVRKVADELLERKLIDKKIPIALLPMGTANNIAKTLGIEGDQERIVKSWCDNYIKKFDVGRIEGLPGINFLLEGLGYGIFPKLVREMKKIDKELVDTPDKKMLKALQELHHIILHRNPFYCRVEIDGVNHSGKYLLAEIMNSRSIGPQLLLAPMADPGDGSFDIILVPEEKRQQLAGYVLDKLNGLESPSLFTTVKGKNISLQCDESYMHVDDELVKIENPGPVKIEMQEGRLEFLVPIPVQEMIAV